MSREQLLEMARREVENLQAQRIDLAPTTYEVPANLYVDPERWQLEVTQVFGRLPLVAGFTCELPASGSYKAIEIMRTPVLLTRAQDGGVRAFVNMCSHRGTILASDGCGSAKGFRCNYHAWSYDLDGRLVSVFDAKNFGNIDRSEYGLTPLPVAERSGLIFVTLRPDSNVDIDDFLSGYDDVLEDLGFAGMHMVGRQTLDGPNWKVAYDGYRDLYHIPILHRNSFGPDSAYQPDFYAWGSHVRMVSPKGHERLADLPEDQWRTSDLTHGVWTIFPNVSIAGSTSSGYMVSQLFPGKTPLESFTIQNFLQPGDPADDNSEEIAARMAFLGRVVGEEDYVTGFGIQKALATGARKNLVFGRNEGGDQLFHKWLDAIVNSEDEALPALLRIGLNGHA